MTLGKLAELNSILGLRAERNDDKALLGIALASPPMYILCHITAAIYSFFYLVVGLITVCLAFFLTYYCVNYYRQKKDLENQQVYEMVEQILEVLSEVAGPGGKDHVAVNHIRDSLINPRERNAKRDIWKKAVMFINKYESRIRYEIENVHGEDCEIWRWTSGVPHSPSNSPGNDGSSNRPPAKMWQGQAFESLETTHNLPNVSPTSCLKIRNMFDCDV
ncbi:LEM domain [Halocaridina rubra]|uniref:LEM domain n=1 Tax=Halocaridina rubra TaxID=373956 RepID=A0AAN8XKM6_HALRR